MAQLRGTRSFAVGHNSRSQTYATEELFHWFDKNQRKD